MEAIYLHHLGVPCVSKPREQDKGLCDVSDAYFLNPDCLIRFEPGGALITPPMLYSSFISIDEDLLSLLCELEFPAERMTRAVYEMLIENKIIQKNRPSILGYRKMKVDYSGLPTQALFEVTYDCNCDCVACYHADDLGTNYPSIEYLKI